MPVLSLAPAPRLAHWPRRSRRLSPRRSRRLPLAALGLLLAAATLVAACGSGSTPGSLPRLTVGLTYIPDIQFAPFYVAAARGYYRQAGIDVTLHHGIENDEFALIAAGKEDAIFAGGDETLEARASSGLPLIDVATVFQRYPVALIVPADSPIHTAADLRGHTIGVPGKFGATYTGLLALLHSAGLSESDVQVQTIGFTQVAALVAHKVDAVMGYLNNEAVQLPQRGFAIRTLAVADAQPLVSNGLVVLQGELSKHPDEVRALVSATLHGLRDTIADPRAAVTLSEAYVPNLGSAANQANALAVLQATIPLWQSSGKAGYNDPATWQSMAGFLQAAGLVTGKVDVTQAYSNAYLPA